MDQQGLPPQKTYFVAADSEGYELRLDVRRACEVDTVRGHIEIRRWTISPGNFAGLPFARRPRQRRYGNWGSAGPL